MCPTAAIRIRTKSASDTSRLAISALAVVNASPPCPPPCPPRDLPLRPFAKALSRNHASASWSRSETSTLCPTAAIRIRLKSPSDTPRLSISAFATFMATPPCPLPPGKKVANVFTVAFRRVSADCTKASRMRMPSATRRTRSTNWDDT